MSTISGVETQTHRHPRRRMMLSSHPTPSLLGSEAHSSPRLRKGETFHSSSRPPKSRDPLLHFPMLPRRSPTSPEALEAIAAGQQRMASILDNLEHDMRSESSDKNAPYSPVPRRSLRAPVKPSSLAELSDKDSERSQPALRKDAPAKTRRGNCHASDSGLGSSICSVETAASKQNNGMSPSPALVSSYATANHLQSPLVPWHRAARLSPPAS